MFKNLKLKIKNLQQGITLIEIIVAIFIIALFSTILITNFPKVMAQASLSRAAYKLAQDLRRAQDLSLSGAEINGQKISGYGIYLSFAAENSKQYLIYVDNCPQPPFASFDFMYDSSSSDPTCLNGDNIIEKINIEQGVYIKSFGSTALNNISIDFTPPNPTTTIKDAEASYQSVDIYLGLTSDHSQTKKISVNSAGLIEVQ